MFFKFYEKMKLSKNVVKSFYIFLMIFVNKKNCIFDICKYYIKKWKLLIYFFFNSLRMIMIILENINFLSNIMIYNWIWIIMCLVYIFICFFCLLFIYLRKGKLFFFLFYKYIVYSVDVNVGYV